MLVIKDFATTILASALTAAATSVVVSDASRLPALSAGDYYYLVLQKFTDRTNVEVVKVTGATGNTLTVVRAQAGTTAKSFAIGDYAEQRVTVGTFSEYIAQSVADKVDKSGGHVEQSLGLLNTGDLVKATVGISYDATNGHGTILSGGEGANKATPYVALRPLGVADSSVQLKYAQDGSLILSGGSRYVETGLLSMRHPQDANGWPNATNNDANNYNNRARGKVHVNNNALYFIADGTFNARRFGIQSGHESPGYATAYGILDLNPFGGTVRVNGGTVYHTNYVPTPAAVGALALAGGTLTGALDQNMGGYGGRMLAAGGYAYLQGGKVGGDTADQKLRITGINLVPLTEFDILTAGHGVAKANGARIYTEQYVPTPSVLGVVPQARTINSKPLTSDITLSAADVGAVAAADNTYWRRRGLKTDLNTADNARPGYFSVTPTSVGMPIAGIYGHGLTVGPGDDAQYDVWYSQILFGHNNRIYTRNGVNGAAAGAWNYIFTSTDKPTAADVGALPITGGTLTGNLTAPAVLVSSAQNTSVNALTRKDYVDSAIAAGDALQVSKSGDTMTGNLTAPTFTGALVGDAATATKLLTARTINGTDFDGSGNITTANWGTARTLTIGDAAKSVNGSANVSWSLAEIGAAPASHTHNTIVSVDNRALKPSGSVARALNMYFTSKGGLTGTADAVYGDLLVLNGYSDTTGGVQNALFFGKTAQEIIHYQGAIGATQWSSAQTIAYTSSNVASATKLQTARTINGTDFDGSGNITTANWGTARTLTIGNSGKSVNGAGNVSWSLAEIGAAAVVNSKIVIPVNSGALGATLKNQKEAGSETDQETWLTDKPDNVTGHKGIGIKTSTGPVYWNGTSARRIYNEDFKPTAVDVGALPITGGTLTGNLTAPAVLVSSAQNTSVNALTRKDYVDSAIAAGDALQVSKSGDTMTGDLTAPKVLVSGVQGAEDNALTRKDYVDSQVATRAPTAHTHTVANVDGLQTALDGKSATSHTHTAADVGALPVNANAVSATKLQTARTINGTDFDGSGNITTANWGTARTLTIGNSGKSVNGAGNVSWSLAEIGAARSAGEVSSGAAANISTATFVQWLESIGAFNDKSWTARCSWSYAANRTITDTGCGNIHLAGCTIEVISTSTSTYTIRVITPTTSSGGTTGAEFVYVNNGPDYAPGWRRIYTTSNKPTAADVGALPVQAAGGVLEVGKYIDFHDAGTNVDYSLRLMQEGTSLRVQGANGYVDVGAKNTGFAHYYTDRPQHYFDKDVNVNDLYVRSDVRLKSNLEPLSDALAKVCSLKGWTYDKKLALDSEAVYRRETGLIAQDVQKVLPSAVHAVEGGLLTLSSSALVALLVEAVKELSEKVKELEYGRT